MPSELPPRLRRWAFWHRAEKQRTNGLAEATGWAARWSPDGSSIYFVRDDNLWVVSADGGDEQRLTVLVGKRGLAGGLGLATDGRYLYFTWGLDTGDIWVMDVVTDESE